MSKPKQSLVVAQHASLNSPTEFTYIVESATNITDPAIGAHLSEKGILALIERGVTVHIHVPRDHGIR